jgi:hypothetical protein
MEQRVVACTAFLFLALPVWAGPADRAKEGAGRAADDFFGLTKLQELHLTLSEEAWEEMQPLQAVRPNPPRDRRPDKEPADPRKAVVSQFGYEFPYVRGDVEFRGKVYKDVGIRFKGNSAYMASAQGLKRPFKLDFNRHVEGQRFCGLTTLNLTNNAFDASQMREALSYHVYRAAGVPSPRTAYAQVYLTVPNRFEREFVGLYTAIEQIDKTFAKDRFKTGDGLLLKPERLMGLPHFGDDWSAYVERYQPKTAGTEAATRQFMAFTKFLRDADDDAFRKGIAGYIDVDAFLRYVAASVVLANMDSFLSLGHNYYMHVHPETNRVSWLPWDLNLSFGGLMLMSADHQMDLSIRKPSAIPNRLIERVLSIKEYDEQYRGHLKALITGCFKPEAIKADVEAVRKVIKEPLEREAKLAGKREPPPNPTSQFLTRGMPALETFIDRRVESVTRQLEGKSEGKTPTFGLMPQPPKAGEKPARNPFGMGAMLGAVVLRGADLNKDGKLTQEELLFGAGRLFHDFDADRDNVVAGRELVEGLNRVMAQPGFGMAGSSKWEPPPQLKTKRKPPAGMGAGFFLGDPLLKVIDPDHDDKVTLDEGLAGARRLFAAADQAKKGELDRAALAAALESLIPATPGLNDAADGGKPKDAPPKKE